MAFTDGNSVTASGTDYNLLLSSTGLNAAGYPISLACAFKPNNGALNGIRNLVVACGGLNTSIGLHLFYGREAAGGGTHYAGFRTRVSNPDGFKEYDNTDDTNLVITDDAWHIIAASFDAYNDLRWSLDGSAVATVSATNFTNGAFVGDINTVQLWSHSSYSDSEGIIAWHLAHAGELTDGQLVGLTNGTTDPTTLSATEFVYYEAISPFDSEGAATGDLSVSGTGALTQDGTNPTGWPTAAGGPVITDVSIDEAWVDGDTAIPITGTGFV